MVLPSATRVTLSSSQASRGFSFAKLDAFDPQTRVLISSERGIETTADLAQFSVPPSDPWDAKRQSIALTGTSSPFTPGQNDRIAPLELRLAVKNAQFTASQPLPGDDETDQGKAIRRYAGVVDAERQNIEELKNGKKIYSLGTGNAVTDESVRNRLIQDSERSIKFNQEKLEFYTAGNFLMPPER